MRHPYYFYHVAQLVYRFREEHKMYPLERLTRDQKIIRQAYLNRNKPKENNLSGALMIKI